MDIQTIIATIMSIAAGIIAAWQTIKAKTNEVAAKKSEEQAKKNEELVKKVGNKVDLVSVAHEGVLLAEKIYNGYNGWCGKCDEKDCSRISHGKMKKESAMHYIKEWCDNHGAAFDYVYASNKVEEFVFAINGYLKHQKK